MTFLLKAYRFTPIGGIFAGALLFSGCSAYAVSAPIADVQLRSTPLYFGEYVTPDPAKKPIRPPERFVGYHVGTDFEITTEELEKDILIHAICSGKVSYAGFAEGYGGVIMEQCTLKSEAVTVIYGHLKVSSLVPQDSAVTSGDVIAMLAPAKSHDSDGNRKHLHLGIHLGSGPSMLGYVQTEAELKNFMDAQQFWPPVTGTHSGGLLMTPYWMTKT